jgi:hypothetical protein
MVVCVVETPAVVNEPIVVVVYPVTALLVVTKPFLAVAAAAVSRSSAAWV